MELGRGHTQWKFSVMVHPKEKGKQKSVLVRETILGVILLRSPLLYGLDTYCYFRSVSVCVRECVCVHVCLQTK